MSPAQVSISINGQPVRTLETAVGFVVVNDDLRSVVGCMIAPAEFAAILRRAADRVEAERIDGA